MLKIDEVLVVGKKLHGFGGTWLRYQCIKHHQ